MPVAAVTTLALFTISYSLIIQLNHVLASLMTDQGRQMLLLDRIFSQSNAPRDRCHVD